MAEYYCWSGAAGAGTGVDWANAFVGMVGATAAMTAGDTLWVAHDHTQTTAALIAIVIPTGAAGVVTRIITVNRGGSVPPVAADVITTPTSQVATTGANAITITGGVSYFSGVIFNAGSAGSNANVNGNNTGNTTRTFEYCAFRLTNTNSSSRVNFGASGCVTNLRNCSMQFGAVTQGLQCGAPVHWENDPGVTPVTGANIPTVLLATGAATGTPITLRGLDLSVFGSGKTLGRTQPPYTRFENCRLDASVTLTQAITTRANGGCDFIGCDSGAAVLRNERYKFEGALTTETTIVRTGGANLFGTGFSWEISTTADATQLFPFTTFDIMVLQQGTGSSKTLTVEIVNDGLTLTNADIWVEVEYLGTSAAPVSTVITDGLATVLTTPANQASSSASWTTTGLASPVTQKLEVSFTPQLAGYVRARVYVGRPSTTVYVDPVATIT